MRKNFFIIRCRLKSGIPARNSQTFELSPKFGKQKTATRAINKKRLEDSAPPRRVRSENFAPSANAPPPMPGKRAKKAITRAVPPARCPRRPQCAPRENLPAPPQKTFPPQRKAPRPFTADESRLRRKMRFPCGFPREGNFKCGRIWIFISVLSCRIFEQLLIFFQSRPFFG